MKKTYSEKLKDPKWQKKRLEILERDGFKCLYCGDEETTLHVHHKKYNGNPWEAKDDDLESLCEHCHKAVEFIKKDLDVDISKVSGLISSLKIDVSPTFCTIVFKLKTAIIFYTLNGGFEDVNFFLIKDLKKVIKFIK